MKKIFISSIVALALVLGSAGSASAQNYHFSNYLTVGSRGADVIALQTWLIANNYAIPAITSGAAQKGYFGQQTKTAVMMYQSAHAIPNTGFVGPLTLASLNGQAGVAIGPASCPLGYTCTVNPSLPAPVCPLGYTCTANVGTQVPPGTIATPGVISTPGVAGTLALSLWSTPSGVNTYKGQSYDVGTYKVQASASDMLVSNLSLDFSDRLWLYANAITVKDETGAIVGTVTGLAQASFSELTVGTDYRISIPVNGLVIRKAQSKYLTVNISFNSTSDRSTTVLSMLQAQIRAIDGTNITDTETTIGTPRTFTYNGSNIGQVFVTTDINQPKTRLAQISSSVPTNDVLLGIFDVKSANAPGTLQNLKIGIKTNGVASISSLFTTIQIKVGSLAYSASTICTDNTSPAVGSGSSCVGTLSTTASSTVFFTGLQIPLLADVYTPVSVYVNVAADTTGALSGAAASTTLMAVNVPTNTSLNNPSVIDSSFTTLVVNTGTVVNNDQTFSINGLVESALSTSYVVPKTCSTDLTSCTQNFSFVYSLTAGNNAIYISKNQFTAISTSSTLVGITVSTKNFADNDTSGDGTTYFYIAPGQTKTFTAQYQAAGAATAAGGVLQVTSLNYGVNSTTMTTPLTSSTITNSLKAVLFQ